MKDVATMEELQEEKFTVFLSDEPGVKSYQSMVEKVHAEKNVAFRCDSMFTILTMISASHLIGYVPEVLFKKYKDILRLKKLEAPFTLPPLEVYMIYNRSALNSAVFSTFIEQLAEK